MIADEVTALFNLAEDYFTEPRLDNVKSHIGEVTFPRDLGRVSGLLAKRAIDFIKGIIGMP